MKISDYSPPKVTDSIGHDVWMIGGNQKGFRATLRSMSHDSCVVSMPGYHSLTMKLRDVCTE
jgi:hypothetical protein